MILILTKANQKDNSVKVQVTLAAEGIHEAGNLTFPNKITWTRFQGALQRGAVGMRDLEVRIDVVDSERLPDAPLTPGRPGATHKEKDETK